MSENNQLVTRTSFQVVEKPMQEAGFSPEKVKQEISFAIQIINKSPQLQKCSQASLQQAVLNVSNIGLTLNTAAKEAYLIPRWNGVTKQMEAALEASYVGLVKLLTDAGSVKSMLCQLHHEKDIQFEIDLADNKTPVIHKPMLVKSKRGELIGVYALATLMDGTRQVEYMDKEEVDEIKERSETYKAYKEGKIKSCTWVSDYGEMARKTVIKRIYKYLPRTERMQAVDKAVEIDNADFMATDNQLSYIESLLGTSDVEGREKDLLEMELSVMNARRAGQVIEMLQGRQLDPVTHRGSYSQAELNKHLKKVTAE
jgi:recombination protein RecT